MRSPLLVVCALFFLAACAQNGQSGGEPDGGGTGSGGSSATGEGGGGGAAGAGSGGAAGTGAGGAGGNRVDAGTGGASADASGAGGRVDAGTGGGSGGAGGGGGGAGAGGAGGRTGPLRIMPLGDSTTGSVCWRALLWQKLNQNGYTGMFDFVGSRVSDAGCTPANYDKDNEGHPGVLVEDFVNDADDQVAGVQTMDSIFMAHPADVVLFHFATNDLWNTGKSLPNIVTAYSAVVDALRRANPKVVLLVAKIIPMNPTAMTCSTCTDCPTCAGRVTMFNDMLVSWAPTKSTAQSPIVIVDQWTGFNAPAGMDTSDGVHPNASGSTKIANKWYDALTNPSRF
jgi:lysophospholipase L1-like esterase